MAATGRVAHTLGVWVSLVVDSASPGLPRVALCRASAAAPRRRLLSRRHISLSSNHRASNQQAESLGISQFQEEPEPAIGDASEADAAAARAAHLNPSPDSYNISPFADRAELMLHAGAGGHGCVSFLREKFVPDGPPNGGDGGDGGGVWIQAINRETSLYKLSKQREKRAGRGGNGQGSARGGKRGSDVLITVPVGTIVREVDRLDPAADEAQLMRELRAEDDGGAALARHSESKWIRYAGMTSHEQRSLSPPPRPRTRVSSTLAMQEPAPVRLDLDTPMDRPLLLVAGGAGGLGNPHFWSQDTQRPRFATRGVDGGAVRIALELKALADVGLVGAPNAGKSTLLRSLSASRTRVGSWAFTTLQPTIGTVVLDSNRGRPEFEAHDQSGKRRQRFTIADIPGLVPDAHLDKGLGLDFLRHVERAGVLAFVIDLSAGDAVAALQGLWREVSAYETLRARQLSADTEARVGADVQGLLAHEHDERLASTSPAAPISAKPWFVVATKADAEGVQANYEALAAYVQAVKAGEAPHPSGRANAWRIRPAAVPVSAIRGEGTKRVLKQIVELLSY